VRRIRLIVLILGVAAATALLGPPAASASGIYTWDLASDFTATGTGANPDHDPYGGTPWTYVDSASPNPVISYSPSTFQPLNAFSSSTSGHGGLAGWGDSGDASSFVGINPTDSPITDGAVAYPAHAIAVEPGSQRLTAVGWTSPFSKPVVVALAGTVGVDNATCLTGATWSLDQDGNRLLTGSTTLNPSIKAFPTVPPGGSIYLTIAPPLISVDSTCLITNLSLTIAAAGSAPTVTLNTPANGSVVSGGQPAFSGAAETGFGASPHVSVSVYTGSAVGSSPFEVLSATPSGGGFQGQPTAALPDGTYTAQAQQSDILAPPDVGTSAPVTFTVENGGPKVTIKSFGSKPVTTPTPTIKGTAGTASGDGKSVAISLYAGTGENGTPVRTAKGPVGAKGTFSARIGPSLGDGIYTAVASQTSAGATGISQPVTFEVKSKAPALTLAFPAAGESVPTPLPLFLGTAGDAPGDVGTITVTIYKGASAKGRRVGRATTTATGGKWVLLWHHQLSLGIYTVVASQSDNAGHRALTPPHRFLIVPGSRLIGSTVRLSSSGTVSVPINCTAPTGSTCTGEVLIVTQSSFQPSGGPSGRLRLLFQFVRIAGGKTGLAQAKVTPAVARILRAHAPLKVEVTLALRADGHVVGKFSGGSTLRTH
jgi:hypothetical protein